MSRELTTKFNHHNTVLLPLLDQIIHCIYKPRCSEQIKSTVFPTVYLGKPLKYFDD